MPDLPLVEAALFGCAVLTGVGAVINTAQMPAGSSAAVIGLGGVGLAALLGAVVAGARTIVAIDLADDKLAFASELGATATVNASDPDAADQVKAATGGGVEYAFDFSGSTRALDLAYQITRRGGTTVTAGLPHPSATMPLAPVVLVAEERTLKGSYIGTAVPNRDIPRYIQLYQQGRLPVDRLLTGTMDLEDINERLRRASRWQGDSSGGRAVRGLRMSDGPWEDMTRRWRDMYQEHAASAGKEWLNGQATLASALADGGMSDPPASATALAELWRSLMTIGDSLWASPPGVAGDAEPGAGPLGALPESVSLSLAAGSAVSEALRRIAEGPRLADVGAPERLMAKVMERWVAVQTSARTYESVVASAWTEANTRFAEDISQRYSALKDIPDAKESLKLWLDTANQVLLETHRSEKFLDAQRQLLRNGLDFMLTEREFIEGLVEPAGLPTRTEIDEVHHSIHELKRRVRALERAAASVPRSKLSAAKRTTPEPVQDKPTKRRATKAAAPSQRRPSAAKPVKVKATAKPVQAKPTKRRGDQSCRTLSKEAIGFQTGESQADGKRPATKAAAPSREKPSAPKRTTPKPVQDKPTKTPRDQSCRTLSAEAIDTQTCSHCSQAPGDEQRK